MYRPIGFIQNPLYDTLLNEVRALSGVVDDTAWSNLIKDPLSVDDGMKKKMKDALSTDLKNVMSEIGNTFTINSSNIASCTYRYLMAYFFGQSNRIVGSSLPVKVATRYGVGVTSDTLISELLLETLNPELLPKGSLNKFGNIISTPVKFPTALDLLAQLVLDILAQEDIRNDFRSIMEGSASHIAYMVKKNRPLDQFEKSFLLNSLDPSFGLKGNIAPAENEEMMLRFAPIKKHIESTCTIKPKSQMLGRISTRHIGHNLTYFGPFSTNFIISQGRVSPYRNCVEMDFKHVETVPFNVEALRRYYGETATQYTTFGSEGLEVKGQIVGESNLLLDEPDVTLRYDKFLGGIVYMFDSKLQGRKITTLDPEEYFLDRFDEPDHEVALQNQSLDKFHIVDFAAVKDHLVTLNREADVPVYVSTNGSYSLAQKKVNLRPLFPGGNTFVRPVNYESLKVTVDDIEMINPDFVGVVQGQLGLSEDEASYSKRAISIAINAWYYREVLGNKQYGTSIEGVNQLIQRIYSLGSQLAQIRK